jgi:uncharacterized OsmC-like protein
MRFELKNTKNLQFNINYEDNTGFLCDQPVEDGGDGEFTTPVQCFVGSIAMCAATYAGFFYKKSNLSMEGFRIEGDYDVEYSKDARIKSVTLKIFTPNVDEKNRKRYESFVNRCLIMKTVKDCMEVTKEFIYI